MCNQLQTTIDSRFGTLRWWKSAEDKVYFLASEMAKGLGYSSAAAMTRSLDEDEKGMQIVHTPGGDQQMSVITEAGFYHAAMKSRVEKAKEFRRWVTHVVLPQIRKTGGYIPVREEDDEKTILAKALGIMKRTIEEKDKLLEAQRPKVQFANALAGSDSSIHISEMAKLLTQNGHEIGRTRLFTWLRAHGYIFKNSTEPMQEWVEKGIFEVKATLIETHHGAKETITPLVTGKGQQYFLQLFTSAN